MRRVSGMTAPKPGPHPPTHASPYTCIARPLPPHVQATSPITLFEIGWNFNYTKSFLRLVRNRGALAALPPAEKMATALWLVRNRQLWVWLHRCGRRDAHKLVKEALACLVESCSLKEYNLVRGWGLGTETV